MQPKRFLLILSALLAASFSYAISAPENMDMFPFRVVPPPDNATPAPVVDFSYLNSKPAGKDGFVTVRDGHFVLNNKRFRAWGTNFAFNGCFPSKDNAPRIARHLARLGINVVRLHSMDCCKGTRPSLIDNTCSDTMHIDQNNLDLMDFFVASLKNEGIYVNINLLVNREPRLDDGICTTVPSLSKNVALFDKRLIELQKMYAKQLLTHTNPYTGNRYVDEPAVAFIEVSNENSFFYSWMGEQIQKLPPCYADEFSELWKAWQREYRGILPGNEAPIVAWKKDMEVTPLVTDYMRFLYDTEYAYYKQMRDYLKNDLAVKSLVTGTMAFTFAGAMMQAEIFDFVDIHGYWHHPGNIKNSSGKEYYGFENSPMVWNQEWGPFGWMSCLRVIGKPFTVSEYNTTTGHWYACENIPMGAAFVSSLDWDGLYTFDWNHSPNPDEPTLYGGFDIGSNPVSVAQTAVGAALYRRGDYPVDPVAQLPCAHINTTQVLELAASFSWSNPRAALKKAFADFETSTSRMAGFTAVSQQSSLEAPSEWQKSNLPKLDAPQGRRLFETSRTLAVIGPLNENGTSVTNGNGVSMTVRGQTFAAITITAITREAQTLNTADKWLLVAGGRTMNTGMEWQDGGRGLKTQGKAPVITENIAADIELTGVPPTTRIYPISSDGTTLRDKELPKKRTGNGIKFNTQNAYKTIWFLIEQPK